MTKQEFESRLEPGKTVTGGQYKIIEYVYMFYPAIDEARGKDQIASLYNMFGMTVINDMLPRARRGEQLENDLFEAKKRLDEIKNEITMLRGE